MIGWANYLTDQRKRNIAGNILIFISYFVGFVFSASVSSLYTSFNYIGPIRESIPIPGNIVLNFDTIKILVLSAVIIGIIISLLIPIILKIKKVSGMLLKVSKNEGIIVKIVSLVIMALVIFMFYKKNGGFDFNPNTNLIALSMASGAISIILALFGMIFVRPKNIKGSSYILLYAVFLYIMVWAVTLRPHIQFFYYYGRYNVPFLVVVMAFVCLIYRDLNRIDILPVICSGFVLMYLEYDVVMNDTKDDTKVSWEVVESELQKEKLPQSAVILDNDNDTLLEWMLILKAAGIKVYPKEYDLDEQTDKLLEYYENVYYMHEGKEDFDISEYSDKPYELQYTYTFTHSEDMVNGMESFTGYPNFFFNEEKEIKMFLLTE